MPSLASAATDFDGDGRQDVAVGSFLEDLDTTNEGAVHALYGSHNKLRIRGAQIFTQDTRRIRERAEQGDRFGNVMAGGDFNGDGRDDLAVAAPPEKILPGLTFDHGVVHVIYGRKRGLIRRKNQLFHQNKPGIVGKVESDDFFGSALAAGDFDNDGRDDLAIGVPGENDAAGAVHVLYGGRERLRRNGSKFLTQNSPGLKGDGAEKSDFFGNELAAGDFDGDGRDDLVIGAQREDLGAGFNQGVVHLLRGKRRGITTRRDKLISENSPGMAGEGAEGGDEFGIELAVGNFDGDRRDDLVVGISEEDVGGSVFESPYDGTTDAGAVSVLYGARRGIRTQGSDYFAQGDPSLTGSDSQTSAGFGGALAAGDLDGDRRDDLAVGAPFDAHPLGETGNGSVQILFGRRSGIKPGRTQHLTQQTPGIAGDGASGFYDLFGSRLAIANLNGGRPEELLIGEPQSNPEEDGCGPGGLHVLYPNRREKLLARGYQYITQGSAGMPGDGEDGCDAFSTDLAAG